MTSHQPMADRAAVAAKIEFEGGIIAALEYGLTEDDMPEGDTELRSAWGSLVSTFKQYEADADVVEALLPD